MRSVFLLASLLFLMSCEKFDSGSSVEQYIIGEWSRQQFSDSLYTLKKVRNLSGKEYGISLNEDGSLLQYINPGLSSTPPDYFIELTGSWEYLGDSMVSIHTELIAGELFLEWKIIEVDKNQLTYYLQKEETYVQEE